MPAPSGRRPRDVLTGNDVERRLLRLVNGRDDDLGDFLAALAPRELPVAGPPGWFDDRLRFLHSAFVRLHRMARRPYAPGADAVFYDVGARKPDLREMRRYWVREYFDCDVDFVVADRLPGGGEPLRLSWRERRAAWRWRRRARLAALAACADFSSRRYRWWGQTLLTIHALAQNQDHLRRLFVGRLYDRRSYVVATWAARHTAMAPVLVFQSSPLAFNQSRLHLDLPVVVTSKVNLPEVDYFRARGTFLSTDVRYCPQEYLVERRDLMPAAPRYDIGFFASGDWARREGRYWGPIEQVRAGRYRGNVYEEHAERVLAALAAYARAHARTLRIYLHPYERRLVNDHGIQPPFRELADGELVTIDDAPGTSRGAVYECDVAVALRSSTIWERIDLGLERSLIYVFGDPTLDNFVPESLGPYRANLFHSTDELETKLDTLFADRKARP